MTLSFFRFSGIGARLWAFAMMGLARRPMARLDGIGFWKLFGSGVGEGFTPLPNTAVYAVLATWPDLETARQRTENAPIFRRYQAWSSENWTVFLNPASARGAWSGQTPFLPQATLPRGPLAALTRATIRPRNLLKFWRRAPAISGVIGADPNVAFKIGIGEVPWLQQVTFSIWPDPESMARFARNPQGPHAQAIRAVRQGD
ncbi:MAG: spheroidene monooxygenase, partial [Pseudomonadota bacterium]